MRQRHGGMRLDQGFSLLEITIYIAVMAIIGIPLAGITLTVSRASADGDMLSKILERNRACILRLTGEYRESVRGTTVITNGGKSLQFTPTTGFNGTAVTTGQPVRYDIRLSPGESANGADDNGNGLIDEGLLVRVDTGTGQEVVLTNTIQYSLSSFTASGTGVRISMDTTGRARGATSPTDVQRAITVLPNN